MWEGAYIFSIIHYGITAVMSLQPKNPCKGYSRPVALCVFLHGGGGEVEICVAIPTSGGLRSSCYRNIHYAYHAL